MQITTPKIIIANWKMNGTKAFAEQFMRDLRLTRSKSKIVICPPFTLIEYIASFGAIVGGQDCHYLNSGAYTGDISPVMLKSLGCEYVLLGHSERRLNHAESSALVKLKARSAIEAGLVAVICIGETSSQYEAGETFTIIERQIRESLPETITKDNIVIAYEPVWAIGTGKIPSLEEISAIHDFIIMLLQKLVKLDLRVIYGGSVKASNIRDLFLLKQVGGVLVGGSSLDVAEFTKIIST
jgi:triosephosphate isomerase